MLKDRDSQYKTPHLIPGHPPALYQPRHKSTSHQQHPFLNRLNNPILTQKTQGIPKQPSSYSSSSSPTVSIEQIKGKIRELLTSSSEITDVRQGCDSFTDLPTKASNEHFRITMFRSNARKRVNLKLLDQINPERYFRLGREVNISEAFMNERTRAGLNERTRVELRQAIHQRRKDYSYEGRQSSLLCNQKGGFQKEKLRWAELRQSTKGWEAGVETEWREESLLGLPV